MSTPKQKAEERPISFVLHDLAKGEDPVEVPLVIRPEDLTRNDVSRLAITQTLGGAYADNFGPGVPTVQISGHTGWGAGNRRDGLAEFQNLYAKVFKAWHELRAAALKENKDPDQVKLIFADKLDDFTWVVAPLNFALRRSRSRPLLAQYQISLSWLSSDVSETMGALDALKAKNAGAIGTKLSAIDSLVNSIDKITKSIADKITSVLGPIRKAIDKFTALTAQVLQTVNRIVTSVLQIPAALAGQALLMAQSLTKAASNIYHSVAAVASIPLISKAYFMNVAGAFENAFCVLKNVLKPNLLLPNYDDLYGSSNCSSTSGGSPLSPFDLLNPFTIYKPLRGGQVLVEQDGVVYENGKPVSADAIASMNALAAMDPVNPLALDVQAQHMDAVTAAMVGP